MRLVPVLGIDVPADVAVAELCERSLHALVLHAGAEGAAEPGLRIDTGDRPDRLFGSAHVAAEELVVEPVHRGVEIRVVGDQVAGLGKAPCLLGIRPYPASLQEERRPDSDRGESGEQRVFDSGHGRPTRKLRVEGEGDAHYWASVTFVRPMGWSASSPFARERAVANSCPGTTESSGESTGSGASGTGKRNSAPGTSSAAEPDATRVAPAFRASSAAATSAG